MAEASEKRANFERLSEKRVDAIREKLRVLGHLASTSSYEYGEEDLERIFRDLQADLDATRAKFSEALARKSRPRGSRQSIRGVPGRHTLIR